MRTQFPILVVWAVVLSSCSTAPPLETRTPESSAENSLDEARLQAAHRASRAVPIDQLDSHGAMTCALHDGDVYCWRHLEHEPFELAMPGPFVRIAVGTPLGNVCATRPDGEVQCSCFDCFDSFERSAKVVDPKGSLVSSEAALCALTESGGVSCEVFDNGGSRIIELAVPGVEFVDHAVSKRFSDVPLVAVDVEGRVYYWRNIRGGEAPETVELPAMRSVEIDRSDLAGIARNGRAVTLETVPRGRTFREVCGVENVLDVGIWAGDFCLRNDEGVMCIADVGQAGIEQFLVGPMHSGCRGPRGSGLVQDATASSMGQKFCVGTRGGQILCRPHDSDASWSREFRRVFTNASQIASGGHFACAKLEDGEVRCTSPLLTHAGAESIEALRGTGALSAGGHLVCGLDGRELMCLYLVGDVEEGRASWRELPAISLTENPDGLVVSDDGVSWRDSNRIYVKQLYSGKIAGPLALPESARMKWNPRQSLEMPEETMGFIARSGGSFLSKNGEIYGVSRSSLDPVVTALGLATGGMLLPAAVDEKPARRFVVHRAEGATDIASGVRHLCFIRGRELFCYGDDKEGRTSGSPSMRPVSKDAPLPIELEAAVLDVSAGHTHTCALLESKEVRCWGAFGNQLLRPDDAYPGLRSISIQSESRR